MGTINGIVCVDKNWGIGKVNPDTGKGQLLFNLRGDMQMFVSLTSGHTVVMGENTLLSLPGGQPLKNRINLVLCQPGHYYNNCICFHSFDEIVDFIKRISAHQDVFIIGGGMFYNAMLPYYDYVYVTKVNARDDTATTFFPNLDKNEEFIVSAESAEYAENGVNFKFYVYERRQPENELTR